jgi:hypothetical protein
MGQRSYLLRYSPRVIHIQEVPEDREAEPVMKCAALAYRPGGTRLGHDGQIYATVRDALFQARYKITLHGQRLCKRCEKAAGKVIDQQEGKGSA